MKYIIITITLHLLLMLPLCAQHLDVEGDGRMVGKLELLIASEDSSIYIGSNSGLNTTEAQGGTPLISGLANTFIGANSGRHSTYGRFNTFIGYNAGMTNTGAANKNTFVGGNSGKINSGFENTFIGNDSGLNSTSAYYNTFIGERSGRNNATGLGNTFIGNDSGNFYGDTVSHSIAIGRHAKVACSNCAAIGGEGDNAVNVGIGTSSPQKNLHISSNTTTSLVLANRSTNAIQIDLIRNENNGTNRDWRISNNNSGVLKIGHSIDLPNNEPTPLLNISPTFFNPETNGTMELGSSSKRWETVWTDDIDIQGTAHISELIKLDMIAQPGACTMSKLGEVYYDESDFILKVCTKKEDAVSGFLIPNWVNLH